MKRSMSILAPAALITLMATTPVTAADSPAATAPMTGAKHEKHPNIHKAMHEIKEAKAALEKADKDFGGHRTNAIHHLDEAMAELEEGLKADKD